MGHIVPAKVADFDFTKDGKSLEHVWEANTDDGWADIIATDQQGNLIRSPDAVNGCPYELIRVQGKIEITKTTKKIGEPTRDEYRDPYQTPDYCQSQEHQRYGCDFPHC